MDERLSESQIVALRQRQDHLIEVISALNVLEQNRDWAVLKDHVFQPLAESVKTRLLQESLKPVIDSSAIYRLQGELVWARRFTDTRAYAEDLKRELEGIKNKLK